jgi:hypothetical protein
VTPDPAGVPRSGGRNRLARFIFTLLIVTRFAALDVGAVARLRAFVYVWTLVRLGTIVGVTACFRVRSLCGVGTLVGVGTLLCLGALLRVRSLLLIFVACCLIVIDISRRAGVRGPHDVALALGGRGM